MVIRNNEKFNTKIYRHLLDVHLRYGSYCVINHSGGIVFMGSRIYKSSLSCKNEFIIGYKNGD